MPTLIIHAPHSETQQNQKQSFSQTVATGRGDGYAISRALFEQVSPGDPVVVICKVHRKQAAGQLKELLPTEKAGNGIQRYDVVIGDLTPQECTYAEIRLNRNGVAVI